MKVLMFIVFIILCFSAAQAQRNPESCASRSFQDALGYRYGGYKRGSNPCGPNCPNPKYCQCEWADRMGCNPATKKNCPVKLECLACPKGYTCREGFATIFSTKGPPFYQSYFDNMKSFLRGSGEDLVKAEPQLTQA